MGDSRTQFGTVEHTKFQAMFVEGIHKLKNERRVGWTGGRKGTLGKKNVVGHLEAVMLFAKSIQETENSSKSNSFPNQLFTT